MRKQLIFNLEYERILCGSEFIERNSQAVALVSLPGGFTVQ